MDFDFSTISDPQIRRELICREIRKKNDFQFIGQKQLERIFERVDNEKEVVAEANRREKLAYDFMAKDDSLFLSDFFSNLETNWVLLESLVDGTDSPLSRRILELIPPIQSYIEVEVNDPFKSGDYSPGLAGLPGIDFELFDKAVGRAVGEKLKEFKEPLEKIESLGLGPLFKAAILHLDFAKGGNKATRTLWRIRSDIDPLVHNEAAYIILKNEGYFSRYNLFPKDLNLEPKDTEILINLAIHFIRHHGIIGQTVRGELTFSAYDDLTNWLKLNLEKIKTAIAKLAKTDINLPKTLTDMFLLINIIDTAAVREGLYNDKLRVEFEKISGWMEKIIAGDIASWEEVEEKTVSAFAKAGTSYEMARRYYLCDRLNRLRGGNSWEKTSSLVFNLEESVFNDFYQTFIECQLWYAQPATARFSTENQMKLFFLTGKTAKIVNFVKLMHTIKTNGQDDIVKIKVIDNYLDNLSWEDLGNGEFVKNLVSKNNNYGVFAVSGLIGNKESVEVDFLFSPDATSSMATINELLKANQKDQNNLQMQQAMRLLEQIYGISRGAMDRGISQERYMKDMDAATEDKRRNIIKFLEKAAMDKESIKVISLGAGTGVLEEVIVRIIPQATVLALDYSDEMIETIKQKAMEINKGKKEGLMLGELVPLKANALELQSYPELAYADAVICSSVIHEFGSFLDNYQLGLNTEKIFRGIAKILKPGGIFIVRDFVQPENPNEEIIMEIGKVSNLTEMEPGYFLEQFINSFKGFEDSGELKDEIGKLKSTDSLKEGAKIRLFARDALEIAAHYSWADSFIDEVKEKYAYFPIQKYLEFIQKTFGEAGVKTEVVTHYSYLQSGYPEHILGRLNFYNLKGEPVGLPPFTGVMVVRKV